MRKIDREELARGLVQTEFGLERQIVGRANMLALNASEIAFALRDGNRPKADGTNRVVLVVFAKVMSEALRGQGFRS